MEFGNFNLISVKVWLVTPELVSNGIKMSLIIHTCSFVVEVFSREGMQMII